MPGRGDAGCCLVRPGGAAQARSLSTIQDCITFGLSAPGAVGRFQQEVFMEDTHVKEFEALPHSSSCRLITFKDAEVVRGIVPKTFFLNVSGMKP